MRTNNHDVTDINPLQIDLHVTKQGIFMILGGKLIAVVRNCSLLPLSRQRADNSIFRRPTY